MEIEFTQFLRPNGRRIKVFTQIDDEYVDKVREIIQNKFRFEIEELTTGDIHMSISDSWGDYANRVCHNDESVTKNIHEMIDNFDIPYALDQRIVNGG